MRDRTPTIVAIVLLLSISVTPVYLYAGHGDHARAHGEKHAAAGGNALLEEMMVLDGVFREVVSAVSVGDGKRVRTALESMHGTMEKTHEAVHAGTVKIPKNSDRAEEFVKLDRDFHGTLEALSLAAGADDRKEMLSLTKKLLDGCVNCHRIFRN